MTCLRVAPWMTPARALAYCRILFFASLAIALCWIGLSRGGLDLAGKPLGTDFASFWAASKLAATGHPADVYDIGSHYRAQQELFGEDVGYAAFFYPPIYLLICLPLAMLPYGWSLLAWLGLTGCAYWRTVRRYLGTGFGTLPIVAFPAVLINAGHGQNGFLSTALFGAGALMLERRPVLAGICFGGLAYKPHLALLIPVALLAARRWTVLVAAGSTALALAALSVAVFGVETWKAFFAAAPLARAALEQGLIGPEKMQSTFAAIQLIGGGPSTAYAVQLAASLAAGAILVRLHLTPLRPAAEGPAMVAAALLASPFLLDYDLVLLAIPLAWLAREGLRTGFLPWEKLVLAAGFVLPAVSRTIAASLAIPSAPLVIAAVFLMVVRRCLMAEPAGTRANVLTPAVGSPRLSTGLRN
jgi:alpha-1,2-mannosyltransferase